MRTVDDRRSGRQLPRLLLLLVFAGLAGCVAHHHRVGAGPSGLGAESARKFYILFGLLPLNEVDAQRMTEDVNSYAITTEFSFVDLLLTPLFLPLTVTSRTVTVQR